MIDTPPAAVPAKAAYRLLGQMEVDRQLFPAGSVLLLTELQARHALDNGVIELAPQDLVATAIDVAPHAQA